MWPRASPSQFKVAGRPSITVMIRVWCGRGASNRSIWLSANLRLRLRARFAACHPAFRRFADVTSRTPTSRRSWPFMPATGIASVATVSWSAITRSQPGPGLRHQYAPSMTPWQNSALSGSFACLRAGVPARRQAKSDRTTGLVAQPRARALCGIAVTMHVVEGPFHGDRRLSTCCSSVGESWRGESSRCQSKAPFVPAPRGRPIFQRTFPEYLEAGRTRFVASGQTKRIDF